MKRLWHVLCLLVLAVSILCWIPAGLSIAGSGEPSGYSCVLIDDYWPLARNGGGALIYEVHGPGSILYGTASYGGGLAATDDTATGDSSWGNEVDRACTIFWNEGYGVWDLGESYQEVVLFPFIDHGELSHAFTYEVYGSNDFSISDPNAATWSSARLSALYLKGWSSAGETRYSICNDDYVGLWSWPSTGGLAGGYRFVKVNAAPWLGHTSVAFDAEVDAVKGVLPESAECGIWETGVVEKGRTFSYTSLEVGWDDRVHLAYGDEQLYYAVRDGSTWHVEEVDSGDAGAYCSLALDGSGYPAISYYDAANGDLLFARRNWWLNAVWGASATDIYAVGDSGTILHYDGYTWTRMVTPTTRTLWGVWGTSPSNIIAVGESGTILRYNGTSWNLMSSGTTGNLRSVWGVANGAGGYDVFAVGDAFSVGLTYYYRILRATYNGTSWSAWSQPWNVTHGASPLDLHGVWASSPTNVFAVGDAGTVIRYNGTTWASTSTTSATLRGIWGSDASHVYAVGDAVGEPADRSGTIRFFNGSGWNAITSNTTDCLNGVWGTSSSDVFAVGCRGAVVHYNGSSWTPMSSSTTNPLRGVWGSAGDDVYAVGFQGTIVRYHTQIWISIQSGNGWVNEIVDGAGNVGEHTSLAYDGLGRPCISYHDATNGDLKVAWWNGAEWDIKVVDENSNHWLGEYSSLAFNQATGWPAISYYDATDENLKLAMWYGGEQACWVINGSTLPASGVVDTSGNVGSYTSLAFDSSGNPAVSYHDATAGSLKYAYWNGSAWQIETVDNEEGWVGEYTCLGFDASGQPGISYFDAINQDLRYAHWMGIGWDVGIVDGEGSVGSHTSLGYDSYGKVVVSYYDATNDAVKVAFGDSDAALAGVWGESAAVVFAVGDKGTIRQYNGQTWPEIVSGATVRLNGVWGTSSSNIYAVGDNGTILHYDGSTWSVMSSGTTNTLLGVAGRSATEIYAVGEGGTILRFDGGSWNIVSIGSITTRTLAAVWCAPYSSDVIAVGESGTVVRYNGSGWSAMASGTTQWLGAVWGNSSSSIFAVGDRGTILYCDFIDSNKDYSLWDPMTSGTTRALRGIWGTSYDDVIAVGERGTVLRFDSAKAKWSAMAAGTTEWLRGIWGSSSSNVYAVGDDGTILKYDSASWSVMSTVQWETETVDPYPWAGRYSSLAFDADNEPAISYYDGREGDLKYAHWEKDHWVLDTVDSYGDVGRYTSLAFDRSGNPCISYYDTSRGNLKYARWTTAGWVVSTVDGAVEDVGKYSSLAFDAEGNAGISYYDATNRRLKYCHWDGAGWDDPVLPDAVAGHDIGRYSSLAFDTAGNAGISYYDVTARSLKYAQYNGSVWDVRFVDWVGGWVEGDQVGGYCSLRFDCVDNPAISYYDGVNGDLKYAHWSGTGWELQVVDYDIRGQLGMYTSLEFDSAKHPAISYHDGTQGTLKLARWDGERWSLKTIDAVQAAGHLTSLEFDRCGVPAISYDSPITGDLKYASLTNPKPDQPVNRYPAEGTTYLNLTPTLECAAFADPCGDSHRASQWMIFTENCEVNCSPVHDSGISRSNLLELEVPYGTLDPLTTYYWCVRHQDCRGAWSKYSLKTAFTTGSPPERPVNVSPANGATSVSVTPTLGSSAFSDPEEGDRHMASQWQISGSPDDFSSTVLDRRVERTSLTQFEVYGGILANRTTYYWRVRYQDNHGTWSEFSQVTSFTTNSAPDAPVNEEPSDGQGKVGLTPTLRSSGFADADAGETHAASQWRITTRVDEELVVVFDSVENAANLTAFRVPDGILDHDSVYYWQVRYQDSQGSWSSWSAETNFGTSGPPAVPAALLVAAAAVAVVAVVAMTAPLVVPL